MKPHYITHPVYWGGELVGYRLYERNGPFGTLKFVRYFWVKEFV